MIAPGTDDLSGLSRAEQLVSVLEAVLFASPEPLSLVNLRRILGDDVPITTLIESLEILTQRTGGADRGIVLAQVAGGWQFLTREVHFGAVSKVAKARAEEKVTPATIETLAIIAYKQPVTRAEVDAIRGAQSGNHIRTLIERSFVRTTGRATIPGAPFTYGTTKHFLKHFGLRSLADLPGMDDLKRLAQEQLA